MAVENMLLKQQVINFGKMWYYYLAYKIYNYYRGKDKMPVFYSFLGLTTLVMLIIVTVVGIVQIFVSFLPKDAKLVVLPIIFIIGLINYFILYANKKYEDVFHHFDMNDEYKKWDLSTRIFIISTIVFTILFLVISDLRNHGYLIST